MRNNVKYTEEMLEVAVKSSHSVAGVLRMIGLKQAGGTHYHISKRIRSLGIDTEHFLGQASNREFSRSERKKWQEILVLRTGDQRTRAKFLRRALIESGVPYVCATCENAGTWNEQPLCLEVDHVSGNWLDDRRENLQFQCPNCHSQTKTYCSKNIPRVMK